MGNLLLARLVLSRKRLEGEPNGRISYVLLLLVLVFFVGLTACGDAERESRGAAAVTLPVPVQPAPGGAGGGTAEGIPESGKSSAPTDAESGLAEDTQASHREDGVQGGVGHAEPISGKYCVLGVYGRSYPDYTALRFDFENKKFNFGLPTLDSSWIRRGELKVEGSRITAVCNRQKSDFVGDKLVLLGSFTWIFELEPDGSLRFIPEGSDEFQVYGTHLDADSVLLRVGDLDKPLD